MNEFDVIVVGGGPGGSTTAVFLAAAGIRVVLLEEKRMPRHKLCGEFITPEAFPTLQRLGVMDRLSEAGAQQLTRLALCVPSGQTVNAAISDLSSDGSWALSLSRGRLDWLLIERAREAGAVCLEGLVVKRCLYEQDRPVGVEALSLASAETRLFKAPVIVDASGRNSRLMLRPAERKAGHLGERLYAMKAHLAGVTGIDDQVELHFFSKGYGGLSRIEDGLVNLCFIVAEKTVKEAKGQAEKVLSETILKSPLARERLSAAEVVGKWYSVGPLSFGLKRLSKNGVIAVGDAAGMIDPFTGTGIQIAMRSGEIAAGAISSALGRSGDPGPEAIGLYQTRYSTEFGGRMAVAGLLRRAVFRPAAANLLAGCFVRAPWLARRVLKATRGTGAGA